MAIVVEVYDARAIDVFQFEKPFTGFFYIHPRLVHPLQSVRTFKEFNVAHLGGLSPLFVRGRRAHHSQCKLDSVGPESFG
jgi:hypothetical protein